eukprot:scaffold213003_cov31-Tisochrysis_lutea.AAC.6
MSRRVDSRDDDDIGRQVDAIEPLVYDQFLEDAHAARRICFVEKDAERHIPMTLGVEHLSQSQRALGALHWIAEAADDVSRSERRVDFELEKSPIESILLVHSTLEYCADVLQKDGAKLRRTCSENEAGRI